MQVRVKSTLKLHSNDKWFKKIGYFFKKKKVPTEQSITKNVWQTFHWFVWCLKKLTTQIKMLQSDISVFSCDCN